MAQTEHLLRWFHGFQSFLESHQELRPFAEVITPPPELANDPEALRVIHARAAMHTLYSPDAEEIAVRAIDAYAKSVLGTSEPVAEVPAEAAQYVNEMRNRGFSFLPQIDAGVIEEMADYFKSQPVYRKSAAADEDAVSFDQAERDLNLAHHREADVLNCPHLLEIATDPLHLGIAQEFLGTVPQVITVAAWWSFAQADEAKAAQLFHLDLDDYRFFKFFIYLSDVDEEAGPHVFVPTTNRHDTLVMTRRSWKHPEAFDNWMGTLRKSDEDVMSVFGIDPVHLTGPAGTNFIAHTRGIHKGMLPKSKNRLLCQVAYGITPQRVAERLPVTLSPETTPNLPADFLTPPMDYVMQLYLKAPDRA